MQIFRQQIDALHALLRDYCKNNKLRSLVLGVSGGIDSAVCAALARPVCDELGMAMIGRSIPIETNKADEIERANRCGIAFCTDFKEVSLTTLYLQVRDAYWSNLFQNADEKNTINDRRYKVVNGNLKARMRMTMLYQVACVKQGMVLSTDNLTEYYLGFWTLHGDVGDFCLIQNLWKSEVYELAQRLIEYYDGNTLQQEALQQCIDAVPTDGLGITSSDLEQIGAATYGQVDSTLQAWLAARPENLQNNAVIQRHRGSEFKRHLPIMVQRQQIGLD